MAKQTFTTGQVLTAAQMTSLQQTAMGGGSPNQKTASYTLVAADAGTTIQMNSASSTTIIVNTSLFSAGDSVQIQNIGSGTTTITAGTATVNTAGSAAVSQYDGGFLYFTSTSSAIWFDYTQSGLTNPLTTTGDMIYSSGGTTAARLAIGSSGQVLTVSGGIPAWATAASGGGMTLLQTLTLSGSSVTTSTLTSTYKEFLVLITDAKWTTSSSTTYIQFRMNSDTGVNYSRSGFYMKNAETTLYPSYSGNDDKILTVFGGDTAADSRMMACRFTVALPNTTGRHYVNGQGIGFDGPNTFHTLFTGSYNSSAAITSMTFFGSTTFTGTAYIYGVN